MGRTPVSLVAVHTHTYTHTSNLLVNDNIIEMIKEDSNKSLKFRFLLLSFLCLNLSF